MVGGNLLLWLTFWLGCEAGQEPLLNETKDVVWLWVLTLLAIEVARLEERVEELESKELEMK